MIKEVEIYTDGACSGNPGKGGYAGILIYKGVEKIVSGGEEMTTNNKMELLAVIKSLSILKEKCKVNLYSDSAYVVNAITQSWLSGWAKNGWRGADKKEIKNVDLWQELLILLDKHEVTFIKVKGHSDNVYNNRCDQIARSEIKKLD